QRREHMTSRKVIAGLRQRAEESLAGGTGDREQDPQMDPVRLAHELQVHQIELEMQNEELRRVQLELQEARDRYFEIYDLAPVSYVTLDREGRIQEANLAAATLLGVERGRLLGKGLAAFMTPGTPTASAATGTRSPRRGRGGARWRSRSCATRASG